VDCSGGAVSVDFTNPFMIHGSRVMVAVVEMFKDRYYQDHTRQLDDNTPFPSQPCCSAQMFYDIIRVWWSCNCNTPILGNRINAKYIRRMGR